MPFKDLALLLLLVAVGECIGKMEDMDALSGIIFLKEVFKWKEKFVFLLWLWP